METFRLLPSDPRARVGPVLAFASDFAAMPSRHALAGASLRAHAFAAGMRWWTGLASAWTSHLRGADPRVERLLRDERAARARNLARARDPFHRERLQRDWNLGYDGFRGW